MPVRLRDSRAASDDGYEDYLTIAEELTRSVRVAASREKLNILKESATHWLKTREIGETQTHS